MIQLSPMITGIFFALFTMNLYSAEATRPASILTCKFTEPFFTFTFDPQSGIATVTGPDFSTDAALNTTEVVSKAAKLVDHRYGENGPYNLVIVDQEAGGAGKILLTINPHKQGSDGMSDFVYPFEGEFAGNLGGCETSTTPAFDVEAAINELLPATPADHRN